MIRRLVALAALGPLAAGLGGCSDGWFGDEEETILPGERVSVMLFDRALEADPGLAAQPLTLPEATANPEWPAPWVNPEHAPQHVAAGDGAEVLWRRDIGAGETDENVILSAPVVAQGRIFALDSLSRVVAVPLGPGGGGWSRDLLPDDEDDDGSLGGGVAFAAGTLYAATAFGEIAALASGDGAVLWRRRLGGVFRAAPAVAGGRVFAIDAANRLFALDAETGETLWTHEGIAEPAGVLGAAVPAVSGDLVLAAYSSGELFALRVENGRVVWSDTLILQGRLGPRASLSDIDASPVIDRDLVFAVSRGGSLAAVDLRSGGRVWDREIAGGETPWIAGDHLYLVTADAEVVCLRRDDGRIRWVTPLPRYSDPEDREEPILWSGPVLAGGALIVASSDGEIRRLSPVDGSPAGAVAAGAAEAGARVAPVVADGIVYLLTRDAELVAIR